MRNVLMAGTAGLFLALGAAGAANAANPNVPSYSPYAIMAYDGSPSAPLLPFVSGGPVFGSDRGPDAGMSEGRAAFIDDGYVTTNVANTNVPSYSPYAIMPQGR